MTSDPEIAERARRLRAYGAAADRVSQERAGQSRLDTLQAAVLRAKLPHLERWNVRRRALATQYSDAFGLPAPAADSVCHLYVIRSRERDVLRERLRVRDVETLVHYPLAVHQHPAWSALGRPGALRESERAAAEVLSLPLYPQLRDDEAERVIEAVRG